MASALGAFDPFYYYPLGNVCPVPPPVLGIERINFGRCGPGVREVSCNQCCSKDGYYMSGPNYAGPPLCLSEYGLACDGTQWPPGFNTSLASRPILGSIPYGKRITSCTVENTLALTFDDGPSKWTHGLLDVLKANDVKATFFIRTFNLFSDLVYHTSHATPAIIRRMYNDGHQIAGHTWSHRNMDLMPPSERRDEQIKAEIALTDILGFFPTYMRPPFNKCGLQCEADMEKLGYHVASYDIDGKDWAGNYTYAEEYFLQQIKRKNHQGVKAWLSLAHDTHERTVHGYTQFMIDNARGHGYKLVTLGECLDDPEENWYRDPLTGGQLRNLPPKGSL